MVQSQFASMGADVRVMGPDPHDGRFAVDVRDDRFEIRVPSDVEVQVLDVQRARRHLLLMVRDGSIRHKFLCGHDERHWFVAAVPTGEAHNVETAMTALKPRPVQEAEARVGLRHKNRHRRRNKAFVRQGEWFFLPAPDVNPNPLHVLRNEPLRRNNTSKAHVVEFCYREGGRDIYVCSRYPRGVSKARYEALVRQNPKLLGLNWQLMRVNPDVFVKGRVRHPDHATITLNGWHRVLMNRENQAPSMRHVAFLD